MAIIWPRPFVVGVNMQPFCLDVLDYFAQTRVRNLCILIGVSELAFLILQNLNSPL